MKLVVLATLLYLAFSFTIFLGFFLGVSTLGQHTTSDSSSFIDDFGQFMIDFKHVTPMQVFMWTLMGPALMLLALWALGLTAIRALKEWRHKKNERRTEVRQ